MQELLIPDRSLPYYEVYYEVAPRHFVTKLCAFFGVIKILIYYLSQFYALWLAVLIKQILKDPIHRLNRFIIFYHGITFLIAILLTILLSTSNDFGVEVGLNFSSQYLTPFSCRRLFSAE